MIDFSFQNCTFYFNMCYKNVVIRSRSREPVAGSRNWSRSRLDRLHNTDLTFMPTRDFAPCSIGEFHSRYLFAKGVDVGPFDGTGNRSPHFTGFGNC